MKHRLAVILAIALGVILLFVIIELLIVKYNGKWVPTPNISREPQKLGQGPALSYVVMGDSTSIGEGADYKDSYALASANHLAEKYSVKFVNVGISGATAESVYKEQLAKAAGHKPDLVLLAVGANDATHFVSGKNIQTFLQQIIDGLKKANPEVKIVVTRSPAMDSVSRFPFGAKKLMGLRTRQVNNAFKPIIEKNNLTVAPIAEETREAFLADSTLTASDNFHPNARGYALWIPVINKALDDALSN